MRHKQHDFSFAANLFLFDIEQLLEKRIKCIFYVRVNVFFFFDIKITIEYEKREAQIKKIAQCTPISHYNS